MDWPRAARILAVATWSLAAAACSAAQAQERPSIPSLDAISAFNSRLAFARYRPPDLNPYDLNPYYEGPSMSAQEAAPSLGRHELEFDTGAWGIVNPPVLGKLVFDPLKDFTGRSLLMTGRYVFGPESGWYFHKPGFWHGAARGVAGAGDLLTQSAASGELPALWDFFGEFQTIAELGGGKALGIVSGMLDSNVAEAPEPGQGAFYLDLANLSNPNSTYYAGAMYGPSGQYIMVNTETPGDWAPSSPQPGNSGPGGGGDICEYCASREYACWCICFPTDFDCCDPDEDPDCSASMLKALIGRKSLKKGAISKAFTPRPKSAQ